MQQDRPKPGKRAAKSSVAAPSSAPAEARLPLPRRIVYADALTAKSLDAWAAPLAAAAALGFQHVATTAPFRCGQGAARHHIADFTQAAESLGGTGEAALARLRDSAARRGLGLILDIALDGVVEGSPEAAASDGAFAAAPARLDPRRPMPSPGIAVAADAERLAAFWTQRLQRLVRQGVAGFRLLGLSALPPAWLDGLLRALRSACPDAVLLGWTPGLGREALDALPPGVLSGVASSFPWWDGRAPWFWDEMTRLRRAAPVYVAPETFDGEFGTAIPTLRPARLAASALLGDGWIVPARLLEAAGPWAKESGMPGEVVPLLGSGPVLGIARAERADLRRPGRLQVLLANLDPQAPQPVPQTTLLTRLGTGPAGITTADGGSMPARLAPGAAVLLSVTQQAPGLPRQRAPASEAAHTPRLGIEAVSPAIEEGRFPVKRLVGERVTVEADIIGDGHDKFGAMLRWREPGEDRWQEAPLTPLGNDRWTASFPLSRMGLYQYQIQAWRDAWATFHDELSKKVAAGVPVALELREGMLLVETAIARSKGPLRAALRAAIKLGVRKNPDVLLAALLSPDLSALMRMADDRPFLVELAQPIPVRAERQGAAFASWYEVFPRSLSDDASRHGTFRDVERHLPRIAGMGFDVLYFPPIHPIGTTNRKGRNNALKAAPDDPGSPYAIGSAEGGHDAIHPELGTLADFQHLREAAEAQGLEIALDFAIQCSPDHPWLKQHPEWFTRRADGSIRFAENPPKKYEDIVNVDFYAPGAAPGLWEALRDVVMFWAEQGVRLFRVDNPHTKPLPFWEWLIADVQGRFPDTVFLAEAFTRPKVMYRLAKVGFSQSYTYFTWRDTKQEFQEYLTELTQSAARDFFRPHFFVNTPDINPVFLQTSGRAGFLIRAALAATLSGLWGVYNGFDLCEATPVPGREEYLDSEKYEIRAWDWDRPGNIVAEITQLNRLRRLNPALHSHLGLTFLPSSSDQVLFYEKATPDRDNVVLVAVSLDPHHDQRSGVELPFWRFGRGPGTPFDIADLLTGAMHRWAGGWRDLVLTPSHPYQIWRISPSA